jgi:hypothetical protein
MNEGRTKMKHVKLKIRLGQERLFVNPAALRRMVVMSNKLSILMRLLVMLNHQ